MSLWVTFAIVGLAAGSLYGLAAVGLVLSYRTTGVFNFAHGALGALAAYAFVDLRGHTALPTAVLFALCVAGVAVLCAFVLEPLLRRVAPAPLQIQLAATVGLLLLTIGGIEARWGDNDTYVPNFLPTGAVRVAGARVGVDRLLILSGACAFSVLLGLWYRRSHRGRLLRAVVDNPVLLAHSGLNPIALRRWGSAIGGASAAATGILLAPTLGLEPTLLTLVVLQSAGAAAAGRFAGLTTTYLAGMVLGAVEALAHTLFGRIAGLAALPAAIPLIGLAVLAVSVPSATPSSPPTTPPQTRPRRLRRWAPAAVVAAFIPIAPHLAGPRLPVFTEAAAYAVVFASLALLVNGAGQVNLGHCMFCALGAAAFTHVATPVTLTWAAALIVAMAVAAAAGVAVASLTIRAGGLGLALATFAVAAVAERTMYRTRLLFGTTGIRAAARPAGVLGADRGYFYVAAVIALLAVSGSALLGRSDAGRMWRAAGDDPVALSALGGSVLTSRVLVFAIAAGLAGLGGALAAAGAQSVSANTFATFPALSWLAVLAIAGRRVGTTAARAAPAFALAPVYLSRFVGAHPLLWFGGAAVAASLIRARPIRSGAKA